MSISARFAPVALAFAFVSFTPWTGAADLNGAWAQNHTVCSKVFVKGGNKISFTPNAELYGSGVLIEGKTATGTFQKCRIKSSRADGNTLHILAGLLHRGHGVELGGDGEGRRRQQHHAHPGWT